MCVFFFLYKYIREKMRGNKNLYWDYNEHSHTCNGEKHMCYYYCSISLIIIFSSCFVQVWLVLMAMPYWYPFWK